MKRLLTALALLLVTPALAQSPVITQPFAVATTNNSSTITSTGTFQSIWTALSTSPNTARRSACTVQNLSTTNTMYVYFGTIASATTPTSVTVAPGNAVYCNVSGNSLQDQVSITGTTGDPFYAAQQ